MIARRGAHISCYARMSESERHTHENIQKWTNQALEDIGLKASDEVSCLCVCVCWCEVNKQGFSE